MKGNEATLVKFQSIIIFNYLSSAVEITVAAHDTTGGMVTKISEASMIAKLGIDVYIVKVMVFGCFPLQ